MCPEELSCISPFMYTIEDLTTLHCGLKPDYHARALAGSRHLHEI